jgi:predicted phage-related endonuclease
MRTYIEVEQGSPEWFAARLGIPTASEADTVLAQKGPRGGEPKGRRTYMLTLLGERMTGQRVESYSNAHMERGKVMEAEARDLYALLTDEPVAPSGFWTLEIEHGRIGASPDSTVGEHGLLEIKTKLPHLHLDCLLRDEIPAEHVKQIMTQMLVTGREWCDFMSYWPGLPPFIKRMHAPDAMTEIRDGFNLFLAELNELDRMVRSL